MNKSSDHILDVILAPHLGRNKVATGEFDPILTTNEAQQGI